MGCGLLTASRLAVLRRCPREHHYRYTLGLQGGAGAAASFGTLVHLGLEAWWREGGAWAALEAVRAVRSAPDATPYDRARAEALLIGYDARWGEEGYEVLGVEMEWRADLPLPGPLDAGAPWLYRADGLYRPAALPPRLGGKFDALARKDGRVLVVEHKTTTQDISLGSPYWARLRLDGQVSLYHLGARAMGYDVEGILYDVLQVPKTKPERTVAEVRMTKGKTAACPACRGPLPSCALCGGTGRIQTEPPRPYAGQRLTDETPEEYRDRLVHEIAADPDRYYVRQEVVRLEQESRQHLAELRELAQRLGDTTQTPENCVRYGSVCSFFPLCTGEKHETGYVRSDWPHPELTEDK